MKKALTFLFWMLPGIALGVFAAYTNKDLDLPFILSLAGWFFLLFVPMIVIHELGHLVAGKLAGFKFLYLMVGRWMVYRENAENQKNLKYRTLTGKAMSGGLTAMYHRDGEKLSTPAFMFFIVGGALANAIIGILGLWVLLNMDYQEGLSITHSVGYAGVVTVVLLSFLMLVLSLFPSRAGGFSSDGLRILQLMRSKPVALAMNASMAAVGLAISGPRPREWSEQLVKDLDGCPEDTMDWVSAQILKLYVSFDCGDIEQSKELHTAIVEHLPIVSEQVLGHFDRELAFFDYVLMDDPETAQQRLAAGNNLIFQEVCEDEVLATCQALYEQDINAVDKHLQQAKTAIQQSLTPAMAEVKVMWTEAHVQRALEASGTTAPD